MTAFTLCVILHQFSNSRESSASANQDDEATYSEGKGFRHELRAMIVVPC